MLHTINMKSYSKGVLKNCETIDILEDEKLINSVMNGTQKKLNSQRIYFKIDIYNGFKRFTSGDDNGEKVIICVD